MVYLIGTGPGDPSLLTVRGAELLRRADAVVWDASVGERVLDAIRADARRAWAGDAFPEAVGGGVEVAGWVVDAAARGEVVVRLYGGDPFLTEEGVGEALALARAGISFEVVPGVAAGVAAAALAGIPVAAGRSGVLAVGTEAVAAIGGMADTVVLEVKAAEVRGVVEALACENSGAAVAVVARGGTPQQRTITGSAAEVVARVEREGLTGRVVVIVGEGVRLREPLNWFEARPLFGRRVVVTRARAQAADLVVALEDLGAEVDQFPMIRIVPPADPAPLRRAVEGLGGYDWIVFTSVNGVERFWEALEGEGLDARALGGVRVACVGPATAAALELRGVRADVVPTTAVGEAVVGAMEAAGASLVGARVLLPLAAGARDVVERGLAAVGARADRVEAYRTVPDATGAERLREKLDASEVDVITFTSPSAVETFVASVGRDTGRAVIAVIGPVTAEAARKHGLPVDVEAAEHTTAGLVAALARHFGREPGWVGGV